MKLRIDPAAKEETQEAAQWYEDRRGGLGLELLAAVDAGVQRIRNDPFAFALFERLPKSAARRPKRNDDTGMQQQGTLQWTSGSTLTQKLANHIFMSMA